MPQDYDLEDILRQAVEGIIECPECGTLLEPDADKCSDCGWLNILVLNGMI